MADLDAEGQFFQILCTSNADLIYNSPEPMWFADLDTNTRQVRFGWDDKTGNNGNTRIVEDAITGDRVYHIALQKSSGADTLRLYINGLLTITETFGAPLSTLDKLRLLPSGRGSTGSPILRALNTHACTVTRNSIFKRESSAIRRW